MYHPATGAKEVGEVILELTHTDVALVKLHGGVQFTNEYFENTFLEADIAQLCQFLHANDGSMRQDASIYMNSPFTGYEEGTYRPYTEYQIPNDNPLEPNQVWIRTRGLYLGQGFSDQAVDGACGSTVWNDEGNVLGIFR